MTRDEIAAAFAAFGEQVARESALKGPRRRIEGTSEFAAAIDAVIGPACPQLRTAAGRGVLDVLAGRLAEMCGELWQRAYALGKSVGAAERIAP